MTAPAWPPPPPAPRKGTSLWWIGPLIVAVVVAVGVVAWIGAIAVFRHTDPTPGEEIRRLEAGPGVLVVPDDGNQMIGVMTTYDDEGSRTQVVRSTFDGDVTWRSRTEVESRDRLVAVIDDVVLLDREGTDEVLAFDLADGGDAWSARLSVDPTCAECVELVGNAVVARDLDGNLTAIDPRDGDLLWHRPGAGLGDTVVPATVEGTLVVGEALPDDLGFELVVLDPEDGSELERVHPECSVTVDGLTHDEVVDADAFVEPIAGTGDVAVVFGHDGRCVQRWSTTTGEQAWGVALDVGYSALGATASGRHLAFSAPGASIVVDREDGTHQERPVAPEHSALPLAIVEGEVLLAAQVPDLGASDPVRLQGWDLDSADGAWSLPSSLPTPFLLPEDLRAGGHGVIGDSGVTLIVPADDGVALVSVGPLVDGEEPRLRIAALDPATGEVADDGPSVSLEVDPDQLDPILVDVHGVTGGRVAVTVAGIPQLVDLATGEVVAAWPVPD